MCQFLFNCLCSSRDCICTCFFCASILRFSNSHTALRFIWHICCLWSPLFCLRLSVRAGWRFDSRLKDGVQVALCSCVLSARVKGCSEVSQSRWFGTTQCWSLKTIVRLSLSTCPVTYRWYAVLLWWITPGIVRSVAKKLLVNWAPLSIRTCIDIPNGIIHDLKNTFAEWVAVVLPRCKSFFSFVYW